MTTPTGSTESGAEHRLDGQWAVVTGSSKGIGRGIADRLLDAGANVVLVARSADELETARDELRARAVASQAVHAVRADMSVPAAIDALFAGVDELTEHVDIVVANCGSGQVTPFVDITLDDWKRTIDLNLTGTFLACQHAARRMLGSDRPNRNILAVSSIRAVGARPGRVPYSATKAALNQMVRVVAQELAPHGIRINALSPGITATPLALENNPEVFAEAAASVPMGGAGSPLDMGMAAAYLCSPAARFVTGANLVVDGGESLW